MNVISVKIVSVANVGMMKEHVIFQEKDTVQIVRRNYKNVLNA
jgi:hypothetical protein